MTRVRWWETSGLWPGHPRWGALAVLVLYGAGLLSCLPGLLLLAG